MRTEALDVLPLISPIDILSEKCDAEHRHANEI